MHRRQLRGALLIVLLSLVPFVAVGLYGHWLTGWGFLANPLTYPGVTVFTAWYCLGIAGPGIAAFLLVRALGEPRDGRRQIPSLKRARALLFWSLVATPILFLAVLFGTGFFLLAGTHLFSHTANHGGWWDSERYFELARFVALLAFVVAPGAGLTTALFRIHRVVDRLEGRP